MPVNRWFLKIVRWFLNGSEKALMGLVKNCFDGDLLSKLFLMLIRGYNSA